MSTFYKYNRKAIYRSLRKGFILQDFMSLWSQSYFFLKFNANSKKLVPQLTASSYRSLYTNKLHFTNKALIKKLVMIHLFWILDIWKLAQPFKIKPVSSSFPMTFTGQVTGKLAVYESVQRFISLTMNNSKVNSFVVSPAWLQYKPDQWMTTSYDNLVRWSATDKRNKKWLKSTRYLWFLNKWYLYNRDYHKVQTRFFCQVPTKLPVNFVKTLWLRLMRYPVLYNYQWFPILKTLTSFGYKTPLPWTLVYKSKQAWMFNPQAKGLAAMLKSIFRQRTQITEHHMVMRFQDLLIHKDAFSVSFQIFIRSSIFLRQYLLT